MPIIAQFTIPQNEMTLKAAVPCDELLTMPENRERTGPNMNVLELITKSCDPELRQLAIQYNTISYYCGKPVDDLEYRDDIALIAITLPQLEGFLHAV